MLWEAVHWKLPYTTSYNEPNWSVLERWKTPENFNLFFHFPIYFKNVIYEFWLKLSCYFLQDTLLFGLIWKCWLFLIRTLTFFDNMVIWKIHIKNKDIGHGISRMEIVEATQHPQGDTPLCSILGLEGCANPKARAHCSLGETFHFFVPQAFIQQSTCSIIVPLIDNIFHWSCLHAQHVWCQECSLRT